MTTHFHILVETPDPNLARGMHRLNSTYAQAFNERHGTVGHLFESRYHSVLVESDGHLLERFRYIALNPVRAGLCAAPERWPWSSYRASIARTDAPPLLSLVKLLRYFDAGDPDRARARLRAFVEHTA
jgi:hypothetical protein